MMMVEDMQKLLQAYQALKAENDKLKAPIPTPTPSPTSK